MRPQTPHPQRPQQKTDEAGAADSAHLRIAEAQVRRHCRQQQAQGKTPNA